MCEGYAETCYRIVPECPICNVELNGEAVAIDSFTDGNGQIHSIINCHSCETRLGLVIDYEDPTMVKMWVTPVDPNFPPS